MPEPPPKLPESPRTLILGVGAFLLVLYGGFVVLLWRLGVLDLDGKTDTEVLAAVLGLLGGLFAASLTFVGALLKHSVDVRTLRLTWETEARLRLETSIRAVQLLATSDGRTAPPTQQAGALFTLVRLGQLDLALPLLREIWPRGEISSSAAVSVVDEALRSGDEALQRNGAWIVAANAPRLRDERACWDFPESVSLRWTTDLHVYAREGLLEALIGALVSAAPTDWPRGCTNAFLVQFDAIRKVDDREHLRAGAVLAMHLILNSHRYAGVEFELIVSEGSVNIGPLREAMSMLVPGARPQASEGNIERIRAVWDEWVPDPDVRRPWADDAPAG